MAAHTTWKPHTKHGELTSREDLPDSVFAFPKKRKALQFTDVERRKLESIRKSRTEEKRRTQRAAFLLDSLSGQSDGGGRADAAGAAGH